MGAALHPAGTGQAAHELFVGVVATRVDLGLVAGDGVQLGLNMAFLNVNQNIGGNAEVVPGHFVAENAGELEGPQPFLVNGLMILVNIVFGGQKNQIGLDLPAQLEMNK